MLLDLCLAVFVYIVKRNHPAIYIDLVSIFVDVSYPDEKVRSGERGLLIT